MSPHRFGLFGPLIALASLLALTACTGQSEAASSPAASSPAPIVAPTPTPTPTPAPVLQPLRGTVAPSGRVELPAIAVKIDNHYDARPQWGLESTDLVYEELVEGGLTRYVAVWHSKVPAEVGPVRSIRPMDPDIISPLGGIVAYSGGKARFISMMKDTHVKNVIHDISDGGLMFRSREKYAPHNVVLQAKKLQQANAGIDPPKQQFAYAAKATAARTGASAKKITTTFAADSVRSWSWSKKRGAYLRSQNGRADNDANGKRLAATNVVVMKVKIDWRYGIVPKTIMVGTGSAWVSTGGKTVKAKWSKKSRTAPITLTHDGETVTLAPGNTWIELVPSSGSVKIS